MQSYRTFLGMSNKSYTVTYECNNQYYVAPPVSIDKSLNKHQMVLSALFNVIEVINESTHEPYKLFFYCDDFDVAYEWKMYSNKKTFGDTTKDLELWFNVLSILNKKTQLFINDNNFLKVIGKLNGK